MRPCSLASLVTNSSPCCCFTLNPVLHIELLMVNSLLAWRCSLSTTALASSSPAEPACTIMWSTLVSILHMYNVCVQTTTSAVLIAALGSQHSDRRKVGQRFMDKHLCIVLSEGRRADRDYRSRWLHWWYRKLQLCCMLL